MNIAFLGDSITYGYALDDKSLKYSTLVASALGMTEENYGITGTLVAKAGLNNDNDNAFIDRAHLIDNADVAVIFGGTNDYFWSDKPIEGDDTSYFARAVEEIIERVKEKRGEKLTLFVTPYPHNGIGNFEGADRWNTSSRHDTDAKNYNGHSLEDYSNKIVELCTKHGVEYLNLHRDFPFDHRVHTIDGCHPNPQGHAMIAKAIVDKIRLISQGEPD